MRTAALLDQTRNEVVEPHFAYSRLAADIVPPQVGKLRVWQSPHTKSWMLQPLNLTPEFIEGSVWEQLKYHLTDVDYDPDWWIEVPEGQSKGNPYDYYFSCVVKKDNVTKPVDGNILALIEARWDAAILAIKEFMQDDTVAVMQSKFSEPPNQGYEISWYQEGRPGDTISSLFNFYFGDFAVRVSSNGQADLFQRADPQDEAAPYAIVYTFPWAKEAQIHSRLHRLLILPHARNQIEFLSTTGAYVPMPYVWSEQARGMSSRGVNGGGIYKIPGEIVKDAGGGYTITQPGKWGLAVTRRYRPYVQIARIGFNNGTDQVAGFWDSPVQSPYPLSLPVRAGADIDANEGSYTLDAQVDEAKKTVQFYLTMTGQGDVDGGDTGTDPVTPKKGSTTSPELYGYSFYKPSKFQEFTRTSFLAPVLSVSINRAGAPDSEHLTALLDNSCPNSDVDYLKRRAEIPLQIGDLDTNDCLFEGTCFQVTSGEAPAQHPRTLRLEAAGMADSLLRMEWFNVVDFGVTSLDQPNLPWFWTDVVRFCFEACGFDPVTQVVIEEESKYGFRLWADGGAGGNRGGNGAGAGHEAGSVPGQRWLPRPGTPVYEFLSMLVYEILGWHFFWDCQDHLWRVYKRPDPTNPQDATKFTPKCAFVSHLTGSCSHDVNGMWTAAHQGLQIETTRPYCSTIVATSQWPSAQIASRAELKAALEKASSGDPHPEDPLIKMEMRRQWTTLRNPLCTGSDYTHPDYLGRERLRVMKLDQLATRDAVAFVSKRIYYDLCFGRVWCDFEADWGDPVTCRLRKWDAVQMDSGLNGALELWLIDSIEPQWRNDRVRRAHYRASLYRADVMPPR